MEIKKNIKKIVAMAGMVILLGATLTGCTSGPTLNGEKLTQENLDAALLAAAQAGAASVDVTADNEAAVKSVLAEAGVTFESIAEMKESMANYETIIADYAEAQAEQDAEDEITEMEVVTLSNAWVSDDLDLDTDYDFPLSDRKVSKLFDGEVEFDGNDYDAEEALTLDNVKLAINGEDFAENVYLSIPDSGILYEFTIDSDLNVSEIGDDDETLIISLLGQDVEIIDWSGDEVTFIQGAEYNFAEGQTRTIDGVEIKLLAISDDNDGSFVYVVIGEEGEKIYEDGTKTIAGIEIEANDVVALHSSDRVGFATLRIGEEVEKTFEDGDEYEEDSVWEWVIDGATNTIGLVLAEDFQVLDDREGYNVLAEGESLCLPMDYVCVTFDGIGGVDLESYDFELDDNATVISGQFVSGINDYDEVFLNGGKIFEDDDLTLEINGTVEFGDSGIQLVVNNTAIVIGDITIGINLDSIDVNGTSLLNKEDNFINKYGIIVEDPEDSIDDQEITIVIPEEQLYGTITVG